jgi:hypothetical protein
VFLERRLAAQAQQVAAAQSQVHRAWQQPGAFLPHQVPEKQPAEWFSAVRQASPKAQVLMAPRAAQEQRWQAHSQAQEQAWQQRGAEQ